MMGTAPKHWAGQLAMPPTVHGLWLESIAGIWTGLGFWARSWVVQGIEMEQILEVRIQLELLLIGRLQSLAPGQAPFGVTLVGLEAAAVFA